MNIIQFLRKPYLAMFLSTIVLFVSCSQYEIDSRSFDNSSLDLAKRQLTTFNNTVKNSKLSELTSREIMEFFKTQNNINTEFPNILYELNENATDQNISLILENGIFNQDDLTRILNFEVNLRNNTFDDAISNFEEEVLALNISDEKFVAYNTFVNSIKLINSVDNTVFDSSSMSKSWGCTYATIVLAAAIVGVSTLTVASGGLAIGAAIVGYLAAVAAYVEACQPR